MNVEQREALRSLPSVSALLEDERVLEAAGGVDSAIVANVIRRCQFAARRLVMEGDASAADSLLEAIVEELRSLSDGPSPSNLVINGTGVIIQTNLGRAPVSAEAGDAMRAAATRYLALETDLETGKRGGRGAEVELLIRALTGSERTIVVNNNAAAVLLTLAATCVGRKVIVSRGEAVEIGGGFRVPDVLRQSGAKLVEVGTTNRTYRSDYDESIDGDTAAILRVHASNFSIVGFTARPSLDELVSLARERHVLLIEDVGSGCLLETAQWGLEHEPTLAESVAAGVDLICASGDKLLGGPQAGLILGRASAIATIARHPLARALRADKTCLAGLAATLRHYARGEAAERVPIWWSISRDPGWLRDRAGAWNTAIGGIGTVIRTDAVVGGGSLPGNTLPSFALSIGTASGDPDAFARRLRRGRTRVVSRIVDGRVAIDARTVLPDQDALLVDALQRALVV